MVCDVHVNAHFCKIKLCCKLFSHFVQTEHITVCLGMLWMFYLCRDANAVLLHVHDAFRHLHCNGVCGQLKMKRPAEFLHHRHQCVCGLIRFTLKNWHHTSLSHIKELAILSSLMVLLSHRWSCSIQSLSRPDWPDSLSWRSGTANDRAWGKEVHDTVDKTTAALTPEHTRILPSARDTHTHKWRRRARLTNSFTTLHMYKRIYTHNHI